MKKNVITILLLGTSLVGCVNRRSSFSNNEHQDSIMQQNRQLAQSQERGKYYEEEFGKIAKILNNVQDNYAELTAEVGQFNNNISILNNNNKALEAQIINLKEQISYEKKARQNGINKMIEQLSKQIALALNTAQEAKTLASASPASKGSGNTSGPVGSGQFYEHRVESGHTLTTIAAAYEVKVNDIRKTNRLKSDMIRIGQILYIPKP